MNAELKKLVDPETLARWQKGDFKKGEMQLCVDSLAEALDDRTALQREVISLKHASQNLHLAVERYHSAILAWDMEAAKQARRNLLDLLGVDHSGSVRIVYDVPEKKG